MELNREALLRAVNQVKAALASQSYIPALTHIAFDGDSVMAYNDITGIRVKFPTELEFCIPGDMLIKALNSMSAADVSVTSKDDATAMLSAGRSKIKLAYLPLKAFPFEIPTSSCKATKLSDGVLAGIELCLISVGNDPSHPAQMGVTMEQGTVLYSTDNFTLSKYLSESKVELPGGRPVILPTFFCQQLLALCKAWPGESVSLEIREGSLTAHIGEFATLFSKMLVDLEPLDFDRIVQKYATHDEIDSKSSAIPDGFESALQRALLVLNDVVDKNTKVTVTDNKVRMLSTTTTAEAEDSLKFDNKNEDVEFHTDPTLIARGSKVCTHVLFKSRALIMSAHKGDFVHMISHSSAS